eukprot:scaffold394889_cov51-Prasinocladus_malaysianus.AAC.1
MEEEEDEDLEFVEDDEEEEEEEEEAEMVSDFEESDIEDMEDNLDQGVDYDDDFFSDEGGDGSEEDEKPGPGAVAASLRHSVWIRLWQQQSPQRRRLKERVRRNQSQLREVGGMLRSNTSTRWKTWRRLSHGCQLVAKMCTDTESQEHTKWTDHEVLSKGQRVQLSKELNRSLAASLPASSMAVSTACQILQAANRNRQAETARFLHRAEHTLYGNT